MKFFKYTAIDKNAKEIKGSMGAISRDEVIAKITLDGMFPVEVDFDYEISDLDASHETKRKKKMFKIGRLRVSVEWWRDMQ